MEGTGSLSKNGDCIPLSLESSPGNNFLLVLTFSFFFTLFFLAGKHFALLSSFNTFFSLNYDLDDQQTQRNLKPLPQTHLPDKYLSLFSPHFSVTHITYNPFVLVPGFPFIAILTTRRVGSEHEI